jgi:hypothetical protein
MLHGLTAGAFDVDLLFEITNYSSRSDTTYLLCHATDKTSPGGQAVRRVTRNDEIAGSIPVQGSFLFFSRRDRSLPPHHLAFVGQLSPVNFCSSPTPRQLGSDFIDVVM